jgi:hypothetical protein
MRRSPLLLLVLCAALGETQNTHPLELPRTPSESRMPGGRKQRSEIAKSDYKNNLEDAAELSRRAGELKLDLERSNEYVVSVPMIKETEEIEKLAKNIRNRLRRY